MAERMSLVRRIWNYSLWRNAGEEVGDLTKNGFTVTSVNGVVYDVTVKKRNK